MPITITGVDKAIARLGKAATVDMLQDPMQRAVYRLQAYMQDYPAPPPGSTYRRTGTLGKRWTTRITRSSNGLEGVVGNNVRYGPWVQSRQFQAKVHAKTGWRTDEMAVRENEAAIVADFQQAINTAIAA